MADYGFECPCCGQHYWKDESIIFDEGYDNTACYQCKDELDAERRSLAYAEIGDL